jgi:WD40 repeat protein
VGGRGFFSGRVVGLDVAAHLPLLAAVGDDRTVRVWDYQTKACLVRPPWQSPYQGRRGAMMA